MLTAQTPDIDAAPYTIPGYLRGHRRRSFACRFTGLPNTYGEAAAPDGLPGDDREENLVG
jgi:hypothetical protein